MALGDNPVVSAQESSLSDSSGPTTAAPSVGQFQPNTNIFTDPRFLAFGRQQQFQSGQQISSAREQQRLAQIELQSLIPRLRERGIEQREEIQGALESRGLFRSGERLKKEARSRRGEERAVSDAQTGTAQSIADLEQRIAQIRANAATSAMDQAISTEGQLRQNLSPAFQQALQQRELELLQRLTGAFGGIDELLAGLGSISQPVNNMMLQPNRVNFLGDTRVQTNASGRVTGL